MRHRCPTHSLFLQTLALSPCSKTKGKPLDLQGASPYPSTEAGIFGGSFLVAEPVLGSPLRLTTPQRLALANRFPRRVPRLRDEMTATVTRYSEDKTFQGPTSYAATQAYDIFMDVSTILLSQTAVYRKPNKPNRLYR